MGASSTCIVSPYVSVRRELIQPCVRGNRENIQHPRAVLCQPRLARCTKTQQSRSNRADAACCCLGDHPTFTCSAFFSKRRRGQIYACRTGVVRKIFSCDNNEKQQRNRNGKFWCCKPSAPSSKQKKKQIVKVPAARSARKTPTRMTERQHPEDPVFCTPTLGISNMFFRTQCLL